MTLPARIGARGNVSEAERPGGREARTQETLTTVSADAALTRSYVQLLLFVYNVTNVHRKEHVWVSFAKL
jgi:hypothetical protein